MAPSECACPHFRESLGQLGWNGVTQGVSVLGRGRWISFMALLNLLNNLALLVLTLLG